MENERNEALYSMMGSLEELGGIPLPAALSAESVGTSGSEGNVSQARLTNGSTVLEEEAVEVETVSGSDVDDGEEDGVVSGSDSNKNPSG